GPPNGGHDAPLDQARVGEIRGETLGRSPSPRCSASSAGEARAIESWREASEGGRSPPPSYMRILQLVSTRGWSSDAYWAARISSELERVGHHVTLVCKRGSGPRVIERARDLGVQRIETLRFASGVKPASDAGDVRRLIGWLDAADVVHVHRGKEHWLAALANRLS